MIQCKCPKCGLEFVANVADPAAWLRENWPGHDGSQVIPQICLYCREKSDEKKPADRRGGDS